jgi:hypothetical protein
MWRIYSNPDPHGGSYENRNRSANNVAQFVPMGIPTDCLKTCPPTCNYINIVYEELQHLFDFNFGVLVRGIRVIFNKVMFLVTDH